MCCITIDTEVLLANFFGSPGYMEMNEDSVAIGTIEKCAIVLANSLPGYVFYDVTQKKIRELSERNKDYVIHQGRVSYRGKGIDRNQYNRIYTYKISHNIEQIVDLFFQYHLYDRQIKLLSAVRS